MLTNHLTSCTTPTEITPSRFEAEARNIRERIRAARTKADLRIAQLGSQKQATQTANAA